jgi:hypothetical protein
MSDKKGKKMPAMRQSAVRLPRELHERLREAGGEGGMGDEIRRRLENSFELEWRTPSEVKTRELIEAVTFLATRGSAFLGNWFDDPFSYQVLKASVNMLFEMSKPAGAFTDAVPKFTEVGEIIFGKSGPGGEQPPEDIAKALLRLWLSSKAILEGRV